MLFKNINVQQWGLMIQLGAIAFSFLLALFLQRVIPFFRKMYLPTAVLAGFFVLIIKLSKTITFDTVFLDNISYHGIALGFTALGLRIANKKSSQVIVDTVKEGAIATSIAGLQGSLGVLISIILSLTIAKDLMPGSGTLLSSGFASGPGQAANMGRVFEQVGFAGGRSYGLAFATIGYLVACIIGVIYINVMIRKGKIVPRTAVGNTERRNQVFIGENEYDDPSLIDKLTIQIMLVIFVHFAVFILLYFITKPMKKIFFKATLWGLNYLFDYITALLFSKSVSKLIAKKKIKNVYQNNYLLSRISGFCFDIMIICGIASINFADLHKLWIPLIIICVVGTIFTYFYLKIMANKVFRTYSEEMFLALFGTFTGTLSSGMLLLREIDPLFETPAASVMVGGGLTSFLISIPFLLLNSFIPPYSSIKVLLIRIAIIVVYSIILTILAILSSKPKPEKVEA